MHADARGPEPTGGGAVSRSQEDARENIGGSGGQSRIERGGQGRSPSQSLGGQAMRAHLRPSLVRLRSSSNRKHARRAKVNATVDTLILFMRWCSLDFSSQGREGLRSQGTGKITGRVADEQTGS